MSWKNSDTRYGSISIALHWLTAMLVLIMFFLGFGREFVNHDWAHLMMNWHRSIGITILAIVVLRLIWRVAVSRPPSLPMHPALKLIASFTHLLLYAALLTMTLTGWAMTSAVGRDIQLFGIFAIPRLIPENKSLAEFLNAFHSTSSFILLSLIGLHVAAALYHHYIRGDDILKHMLPIWRSKTKNLN